MSGPKSLSYEVDRELLRRRQEEARLDARAHELERRTEALRARAANAHAQHESVSVIQPMRALARTGDHQQRRREQDTRAAELTTLERRLEEQLHTARQEALLSAIDALEQGTTTGRSARFDAPAATPAKIATDTEPAEDDAETRRATVERISARLDPGASEAAVEAVRDAAEAALAEADPRYAAQRIARLRLIVDEERGRVHARERFTETCRSWRERLDARDPAGAAALSALDAAESGGVTELTDQLRALLGQADAAAAAQAARSCAADAIEQAFAELGYDVESGFDSILVGEGYADVRRAEWPGYAVRVRLGAGASELRVNVVRGAAGSRQERRRDAEVEQEWCTALPHLLEHMASLGVQASITSRIEPGVRDVQVVDDLSTRTDRGRRAPAVEPRTMERR